MRNSNISGTGRRRDKETEKKNRRKSKRVCRHGSPGRGRFKKIGVGSSIKCY